MPASCLRPIRAEVPPLKPIARSSGRVPARAARSLAACRRMAASRLPSQGGAVRGGRARGGRDTRLQLLDLRGDRLSPPDRPARRFPPAFRRGGADQLPLRHERGEPPLLLDLRDQELLPAALPSRLL